MSNTTGVDDEVELECRVCRGGPDLPLRPLFSPCLCSGSIGLVHQDCLEAWLKHSQKESCELCKQKYAFDPEYAENVPDILPFRVVLFSALKLLPVILRVVMAVILWLLLAPSCTNLIYKMWFRKDVFSKTFFAKDSHLPTTQTAIMVLKDSTTGLVLMGVICISVIVLVSSSWNFPAPIELKY
jgi:E3 ubiquitin-protein ligase DOA10